jgi:uncharacterized protein YsxB (DUF464 family)
MILVDFSLKGSLFTGFSVYGHSGSADLGHDIICAAVSSAVFMAVNTITDVLHVAAQVTMNENGQITLSIRDNILDDNTQRACQDIIKGLELHLLELKDQYPDNIFIKYDQVI